jgi:hypothetical protein
LLRACFDLSKFKHKSVMANIPYPIASQALGNNELY